MKYEFIPLSRCPRSCGMAAFFFLMSRQNARFRAGMRMGTAKCRVHIDEIKETLKEISPGWLPGYRPNFDEMIGERRRDGRLIPGHDAFQHVQFVNTLALLRPTISEALKCWSPTAEALLSDAFDLSVTTWLAARSLRISASKFQKERGFFESTRSRNERRKAYRLEFQAALHLGNAARDAGRYYEAAKMVYLVLATIPDEFLEEAWIQDEIKRRSGMFHYVGEGGLRKDTRFEKARRNDIIEARSRGRLIGWNSSVDEAAEANDVAFPERAGSPTGLDFHLEHDVRELPEWATVLGYASASGQSHWGYLLTIEKNLADMSFPAPPEVLSASFFLALRYGHVRSAAKLLARGVEKSEFSIGPKHVVEFTHALRKCTQLDPFGMRLEYLERWQKLLFDACEILVSEVGTGSLPREEAIWLHETLLNRSIVLFGGFKFNEAALLYQSNNGIVAESDMRVFYEEAYDFHRRAPGVANIDTVSKYLDDVREESGRRAVAVSVVRFGEFLSTLVIGSNGNFQHSVEKGAPIGGDVDLVETGSAQWFKWLCCTNRLTGFTL